MTNLCLPRRRRLLAKTVEIILNSLHFLQDQRILCIIDAKLFQRFKKESIVSVNVKNSLEEREMEWTVIEVEKLVLNV